MTALRSLGKWALPLLGIWFLLTGLALLFGLDLPVVVMGVLALIVGVLCLLSS